MLNYIEFIHVTNKKQINLKNGIDLSSLFSEDEAQNGVEELSFGTAKRSFKMEKTDSYK